MGSFYDAVQTHIQEALHYLYTCLPAKVVEVKKKGNATVVSVLPMINRRSQEGFVDNEPIIENVPIQWPCGGGFRITCPIEVGDSVVLHFTMRSAMEYKNSDGAKPVTASNNRLHSLQDAFAVPSKLTYNDGEEIDPDALSLGSDSMEIRITKEGTIELGKDAAESVLLGDAFITKYLTHKHEYVDSVGPAATPTPKLTLGISTAPATPDTKANWASTLSTKVKTK